MSMSYRRTVDFLSVTQTETRPSGFDRKLSSYQYCTHFRTVRENSPDVMPSITAEALRARVEAVKAGLWRDEPGGRRLANKTQGAVLSTLSILRLLYGDPSPQIAAFQDRLRPVHGRWDNEPAQLDERLASEIVPILDAALADFESGLTGSVRAQAKGEVLGDFIALAREALATGTGGAERVAAVLGASALEETLKQLGSENGLDVQTRDFRGVIQKLKDSGILSGAQPSVAMGYSIFRDRAFHGQFEQIDRATTESALAFTEGLLVSRLS
jgi:hypothetical protein